MNRVLLLEDDPAILEVVRMLLEEEGFTVLPASSVAEAEAAVKLEFDAAVLDLGVAGMNIEQFIRRIQSLPLRPPVLLCSASTKLEQVATRLNCATLAKPFEIDEFIRAIWSLVGNRREGAAFHD